MARPNSHQVARAGQHLVAAELHRRGAYDVTFARNEPDVHIVASNASRTRTAALKVKTKRKGNWQTNIRDWPKRAPKSAETHFWVFVDLGEDPETQPRFLIVPEPWIREDIDRTHAKYLKDHGGTRPITAQSKHHSIEESRIEQWHDRWDLLKIFDWDE